MEFLEDHFYSILLYLFAIFLLFVCFKYDFIEKGLQISEYKRILNHEFGRDFSSYNDYVLFKIERGY